MSQKLKEEIANAITHGLGAVFALIALIVMVILAAMHGTVWHVTSVCIYGLTMFILYLMSTLYHSLYATKAVKVFKVFDHASIYLLIAGTYTPFTLLVLREQGMIGWVIFATVWALAIIGIVLSTLCINKFKVLKTICYIGMGWVILFAFNPLIEQFKIDNNMGCLYWLIAGGLSYTLGCIFYLAKNMKYSHSIWHLFVLAGSVFHFIAVTCYLI
ncbi:MAG: hemolysin III family protein [Clostridia bacterium]